MPKRLDFDLYPSVLEVEAARAVFVRGLLENEEDVRLPNDHPCHMSPYIALSCALSEVWRQGRIFQRDQDAKALYALASQETPSMEALFARKEARR